MAGLQEPALRKRDDGIAGHDRVVEHPYVNQCQRVTNAVRDDLVGLRGFGNPRGAVVEEEDCEDLVVLNGKPESQVVARGARVRQRGAFAHSAREDGASGVQDLVHGGPKGEAQDEPSKCDVTP